MSKQFPDEIGMSKVGKRDRNQEIYRAFRMIGMSHERIKRDWIGLKQGWISEMKSGA